jgi:hypothetical protein
VIQTKPVNLIFLIAISLTAFLALVLVGFLYGCAKSSRPERPTTPPRPSGMTARLTVLAPTIQSAQLNNFADDTQFAPLNLAPITTFAHLT